ncbi:MAG: pyridoxamine 5'-phosphate oxidase [Bacteroidota bacterium]
MSNPKINIKNLRKNYGMQQLSEKNINRNPVKQFELWMNLALEKNVNEPNAMNLSTVNEKGKPASRIVLLRGFDEKGFVFYTNYSSRKGSELKSNPYASLTFFWAELEKQVRIEGEAVKVSKAISDAYFKSRPRESQIGAWASPQSSSLKSREELEKMVENLTEKYNGKTIPRPPHWGGFCIVPDKIEFWQGRTSRLHDRIVYEKIKGNQWKISRLAP